MGTDFCASSCPALLAAFEALARTVPVFYVRQLNQSDQKSYLRPASMNACQYKDENATLDECSAGHLLKTYFPEGMSEALIGNILFGAIRGLNYMHQNGYIHRNIKASHILISKDGLVSLSGLNNLYSLVNNGQKSKVVYDFPQFSTSVLPWLSPELLRQDLSGYNMKSDIYSVGITACELANGHVPFQDMPRTQAFSKQFAFAYVLQTDKRTNTEFTTVTIATSYSK
ncbi:hypothetical protein BTVI_159431 [Pitangus sulphuratus]|nr:hypothetical protein BTVI_159431 [Pitangus sulphuratus]